MSAWIAGRTVSAQRPHMIDDARETASGFRYRAEELRAIADGMKFGAAQTIMRDLAVQYDRMADSRDKQERASPNV